MSTRNVLCYIRSVARTGFVYHSDYLEHDMGQTHPESPQRLRAIVGQLEESGLLPSLVRIDPKPATSHCQLINCWFGTPTVETSIVQGADAASVPNETGAGGDWL